jgi:hypothetical protein
MIEMTVAIVLAAYAAHLGLRRHRNMDEVRVLRQRLAEVRRG